MPSICSFPVHLPLTLGLPNTNVRSRTIIIRAFRGGKKGNLAMAPGDERYNVRNVMSLIPAQRRRPPILYTVLSSPYGQNIHLTGHPSRTPAIQPRTCTSTHYIENHFSPTTASLANPVFPPQYKLRRTRQVLPKRRLQPSQ